MSVETPSPFSRKIGFKTSYEKRNDDPRKDYGISGGSIWFVLTGPKGAVTWELLAGFFLPETIDRLKKDNTKFMGPTPGGVGFHYAEEREWGTTNEDCEFTGGPCWFDVGYTMGDEAYKTFTHEGLDSLWDFLGELYQSEMEQT
jgi:hypothetical protein